MSLSVDEEEFRHRSAEAGPRGARAFSVLGAVGYDSTRSRPKVWRVEAIPQANAVTWADFLASLPGIPEVVITDGGRSVNGGVALTWPAGDDTASPALRRCDWHLTRGLTQALPAELRNADHPLANAVRNCLTSVENWTVLERLLTIHAPALGGLHAARRWVELNRDTVLNQVRDLNQGGPRSLGPIEEVFRQVSNILDDRAPSMTNKTRADRLLTLLAADLNGWADETAWAELIRDHLHHLSGHPDHQRQITDPTGRTTLRPV